MLFLAQIWPLSSSKSTTSKIPDYSEKFEHGFSSLAWLPGRNNTVNGGIDSAREMQENFTIAWYVLIIYKHFSPVKADTPLEPFNNTVGLLLIFIIDNIFMMTLDFVTPLFVCLFFPVDVQMDRSAFGILWKGTKQKF
jgi:hypothetical protein